MGHSISLKKEQVEPRVIADMEDDEEPFAFDDDKKAAEDNFEKIL